MARKKVTKKKTSRKKVSKKKNPVSRENNLLYKVRKKSKLNQEEFSKEIDIPQSRISKIERGDAKLERDVILILFNKFSISGNVILKALAQGQ